MGSGASFGGPNSIYRYHLWRIWNEDPEGRPVRLILFLMLNPSTADATHNDPTVERCERRARKWGFDGLLVANIFALRSTDPAGLKQVEDPVGLWNDTAILQAARRCEVVVCAWGTDGAYLARGAQVRELLLDHGITPYYLKLSKDGHPCHPLYLSYDLEPEVWR